MNVISQIQKEILIKECQNFLKVNVLYNLSNEAVRCKDKQVRCKPISPNCYNNGDSCGKSKISITKDIGYLSQEII